MRSFWVEGEGLANAWFCESLPFFLSFLRLLFVCTYPIAYDLPTSVHGVLCNWVRTKTPSPARHAVFCPFFSNPSSQILHVMLNRKPSRLFTRRLHMELKYSRGVILTDSGIEMICYKHIFGTTAAMDGVD